LFIHHQKDISVVLVLEAEDSFACEMGEGEVRTIIQSQFIAKLDVLLVQQVDLVGNVAQELVILKLGRIGI